MTVVLVRSNSPIWGSISVATDTSRSGARVLRASATARS